MTLVIGHPNPTDLERAELEAILSSGLLAKAPSLAQFLTYICERHFAGEAEQIKEYSIAVDAFGRGPDFDQKRDSIVRVEAHRLRKRLKKFYAGPGASHEIQIQIPPGGYAPVFVRKNGAQPETGAEPVALPPSARRPKWMIAAAISILGVSLGAMLFATWRDRNAAAASAPPSSSPPATTGADATGRLSEVRIACGSSVPLLDKEGRTWLADRFFQGGSAAELGQPVEVRGSQNSGLFSTWRQGDFSYKIPMKPGVYELTLIFAELRAMQQAPVREGDRLFDLVVNGQSLATEFDLVAEGAGPDTAVYRLYRDIRPDKDGIITVRIANRTLAGILNGIQIVPGTPSRLRPIRFAARETPYTDSAGRHWSEDRYYAGGKLVKRLQSITGTVDPELYRGERYGRITYTVPVPADSTYTAVLHFAETYFTSPGGRRFDVFCNGQALLKDFEPFVDAGGAFRAIRKVFRGLQPAPNGKLIFQLVPSRNYAMINAIEILDESAGDQRPMPQVPSPE